MSRRRGALWQAAAWIALILAAAMHILLPPGWLQIGLAVVAFVLFAVDRRFGLFGAAILLLLALPYDRAANFDLLRVADIPIRPHDAIVGLALLLALPRLRRPRISMATIVIGIFLLVGVVAFALGFLFDNPLRDILRDARWWFLYLAGLFAAGIGQTRSSIVRGMLIGATVFAVVAVATTLLPAIDGGLKDRSLTYDRGTLRMQFGNSIFLIPAICYVAWSWVRRFSFGSAGWLLLLVVAASLTLTRVLVLVTLGSLLLAVIWWLWLGRGERARDAGGRALPALGIIGLAVAGAVLGVLVSTAHPVMESLIARGQPIPTPAPGAVAEDPLDRFFFQGDRAGTEAIASGRFSTYARAFLDIRRSPVLGTGMGTLVDIGYTFGGEPFDTPGKLPNVDNAYLTVGLKSGAIGIAAFALLLLWPLVTWWRRGIDRMWVWMLPAWLGILTLTMTQSFAVTGYSPFVISLLVSAIGGFGYASSSRARATAGA